jgi:hypothetical protein
VHHRISSLASLCFADHFPDKVVWSRESVRRRVGALAHQFADELVIQRISSLRRLCGTSNQFADEFVL